jgi:hypothetical protein
LIDKVLGGDKFKPNVHDLWSDSFSFPRSCFIKHKGRGRLTGYEKGCLIMERMFSYNYLKLFVCLGYGIFKDFVFTVGLIGSLSQSLKNYVLGEGHRYFFPVMRI